MKAPKPNWNKVLHTSHVVLHLCYFGLVFGEAHGMYGWAAGGLLIITLVETLHPD